MKLKIFGFGVLGLILSMTLGIMSSVKLQLLAQTSGSFPSGSAYIIQSGDRLYTIAQQQLGDGNLWSHIMKPDGTHFTQQEAQNARPGQVVYLSKNSGPSGFANIVSRDTYERTMFPNRNSLYTYNALLIAAQDYPSFSNEGSLEQRKREAAAFLANIAHETTGGWPTAPGGPYAWGLYFVEEQNRESQYCDPTNTTYPCRPGRSYHGRGPIQLSWNYNYGAAGQDLSLDLLNNPDLVKSNSVIAFKTALWYWMNRHSTMPSAHAIMTGGWTPSPEDLSLGRVPGFGMTINVINGGIECNQPTSNQVLDRVGFYQTFTQILGVSPGNNLYCNTIRNY